MIGPTDLEDIDERALRESDRVLDLVISQVIGGEDIIEF